MQHELVDPRTAATGGAAEDRNTLKTSGGGGGEGMFGGEPGVKLRADGCRRASWPPATRNLLWVGALLLAGLAAAVATTVILLHPLLHLAGVSIMTERGRQQT